MGDSASIEELMESARERALLDNWSVRGEDVRLTIGTYEIDVHRKVADRFVRGLLRNHETTLSRFSD